MIERDPRTGSILHGTRLPVLGLNRTIEGARAVVRGQPLHRLAGSSRSIADGARGSPARLGSQRHDYESPGARRPGHGPFGPPGTRLPIAAGSAGAGFVAPAPAAPAQPAPLPGSVTSPCFLASLYQRRSDSVGHGPTYDAAFEPIRDLDVRYPRFAIRFTGICSEPLIRPSLVIDDETLELLRS